MTPKNGNAPFPPTKLGLFATPDLRPVPEGWRIGGPDFVGIGAVKSGTSWWYALLVEHPQIVANRLKKKELRYFVHFGHRGLDASDISTYCRAFAAPRGAVCGEWSPIYLTYPMCTGYLAEAAPTAKILVILRNPVDCTLSALNEAAHNTSRFDFNGEREYVYNVFALYPRAVHFSTYAYGLGQLLRHFDRNQILVLQYEKCKADPWEEIARTYRFLGVDDRFLPRGFTRGVNRKDYIVPDLKPGERLRLAEYFADDVRVTLQMFPEIDVALWKDFAGPR